MRKHGYFDLLGCDFMITDDNQLFLLEINTNPALSLGSIRFLSLFCCPLTDENFSFRQ
jgi:hypothetical protein